MALVAAPVPDTPPTHANIAYGPDVEEVGDLYLPPPVPGGTPAVVQIHGGGWTSGSRQGDATIPPLFTAQGVAVFNIDYRLVKRRKPSTWWPASLIDVQLAVRYLRAHAAEYGIDPARIGAMGDSAGAQLAVFLGMLSGTVPGDRADLYPEVSPKVAAVVDEFGPMVIPMGAPGIDGLVEDLFGTARRTDELVQNASPLAAVNRESAPVYIVQGRNDPIVPMIHSQRLHQALQAEGVPVTLVTYEGGHEYYDVPLEEAHALRLAAVTWLANQLRR